MGSTVVAFRLGAREVEVLVRPLATLQAVLRDQLGQTSVKEGCRQGGCGSCTVLLDGQPVASCLVPVEDVAGRRVDTVETLTPAGSLAPVQAALVEHQGTQCGYCTPGIVVVATALLAWEPAPDRAAIADAIAGNVCRCTGYTPILAAIQAAAAGSAEPTGHGPGASEGNGR